MGICISKCCFNPTPTDINLPQPQDKQVISQHNNHPTKPQTSPSSSSNSTSSSSVTSISSASCRKPTSKLKPYTNEFLLSCARENPHIVLLDPRKCGAAPNLKPRNDRPVKQSSIKLASKRERSSSPQRSIARAKTLRRDRTMMTDKYKGERTSSFDGVMKHRRGLGAKRDAKIRSLSPCKRYAKDRSGDSVMEDIDNPLISMECFIFL